MKKTVLILLLSILLSLVTVAQRQAVYVCTQPADLGLGVRVDLGYTYGSISYGNWGIYKDKYIRNHTKVTVGGIIPIKVKTDNYKRYLTLGVNYHQADYPENTVSILKNTLSFEGGCGVYIHKLAVGIRTDILRWEPCVDIGVNF